MLRYAVIPPGTIVAAVVITELLGGSDCHPPSSVRKGMHSVHV